MIKIIKQSTTPTGIKIQLEDWTEKNTPEFPDLYGLVIGAYPVAQRTGKYKWIEAGVAFRLHIGKSNYNGYSYEDVKSDYEALKHGEKKLEDLAPHFSKGKRERTPPSSPFKAICTLYGGMETMEL